MVAVAVMAPVQRSSTRTVCTPSATVTSSTSGLCRAPNDADLAIALESRFDDLVQARNASLAQRPPHVAFGEVRLAEERPSRSRAHRPKAHILYAWLSQLTTPRGLPDSRACVRARAGIRCSASP